MSKVLAALYAGDTAALDRVLAAGADLDLFEAAALGRADRVRALCRSHPGDIGAWSWDGFTALHLAAFFGTPEVVAILLARGADPAARSRNDMAVQPLHSAVARGKVESARMLLAAGADPDARQHGGWTALQAAAARGDDALVALLLGAGADPTLANDAGDTPASLASAGGHSTVADRLSR